MIVVDNLRKSYPDLEQDQVLAVDGVSFRCEPGRIYGLLGPNGAGKTTILRTLATLLKPTSGKATVAGFDVETEAEMVRRSIGFVSNNTSNYDRMSAREMVEFFGRLHGMPEDEMQQRAQLVYQQLQMTDFLEVTGGRMSTGMKQKVSIARAIIHNPPVLIFDEATVGLDVLVGRSLQNTVLDLREQGKCILYSTHHMREVERVCDQIAIMHNGKILCEGSQGELRERYKKTDLEDVFFDLIEQQMQTEGQA
ncbi:MAG: ABC transporter ATP-binding protein [Planctomycetaceae bacterium]|nr:ABC transporter ATP-binding protein [Planctomycetaceae bacterium]|tara:strand:- start:2693 stop:3448 length:756 start_codon:yes stop_codon:yes gene_type:complete